MVPNQGPPAETVEKTPNVYQRKEREPSQAFLVYQPVFFGGITQMPGIHFGGRIDS